jgi:hypothetical protein
MAIDSLSTDVAELRPRNIALPQFRLILTQREKLSARTSQGRSSS